MNALKTLPDLDNRELFSLVRLFADHPTKEYNGTLFLVVLAGELRRRSFYLTEDYVIQLAARTINA